MTTEGRDSAEFYRPEWMSEPNWQRVSAELTERWLELLETAARDEADEGNGRAAS